MDTFVMSREGHRCWAEIAGRDVFRVTLEYVRTEGEVQVILKLKLSAIGRVAVRFCQPPINMSLHTSTS
jgi:hypothetical protein